jgi:hypothetical protein
MRTTITIDRGLLEDVKRRAAEQGSTVSRVIEDSLRVSIHRKPEEPDRETFRLVTSGRGGRFSRFNVDKAAALLEVEDLERYGRADG